MPGPVAERINIAKTGSARLTQNTNPIEIVGPDPNWPNLFQEESHRIEQALSGLRPRAFHIGSTAVPGLCAKPIIDVMIGLGEMDEAEIVPAMASIGYSYHPEAGEPGRLFFSRWHTRSYHVHVVKLHSWTFWRHILFRDYLTCHPELCGQYAKLKQDSAVKFRLDRPGYTESKSDFIDSTVKRATLEAFITIDG